MLLHVELEAVETVTVLVVKIEITVANIGARPVVESVGKRPGQDGYQVRAHAKAAMLRGSRK